MFAPCWSSASRSRNRSSTMHSDSSSLKKVSYCSVPGSWLRTISMHTADRRLNSSSLPSWNLNRTTLWSSLVVLSSDGWGAGGRSRFLLG